MDTGEIVIPKYRQSLTEVQITKILEGMKYAKMTHPLV